MARWNSVFTEFSGKKLALFRLMFDIEMVVSSGLLAAVFLGGDLLPPVFRRQDGFPEANFLRDVIQNGLAALKDRLADAYPQIFLILGNDDPRAAEAAVAEAAGRGVWEYVHGRRISWGTLEVWGYACGSAASTEARIDTTSSRPIVASEAPMGTR